MAQRRVTDGARALRAYLIKIGISVPVFCERNGLDRIQVQRVLNGERVRISVDFALSIQKATKGAVAFPMFASSTGRPVELPRSRQRRRAA
jgi:hypothetical protein